MEHFTFEEMNLMCIYNPGTRLGLIGELEAMRRPLEAEETERLSLTDSVLAKLRIRGDAACGERELAVRLIRGDNRQSVFRATAMAALFLSQNRKEEQHHAK